MRSRLNLGMRLHDTPQMTLEERLSYMRGQGFHCAHVVLTKVLPEQDTENTALTPGMAMEMKKLFAKMENSYIHCTLEDTVPENAVEAANYIRTMYETKK